MVNDSIKVIALDYCCMVTKAHSCRALLVDGARSCWSIDNRRSNSTYGRSDFGHFRDMHSGRQSFLWNGNCLSILCYYEFHWEVNKHFRVSWDTMPPTQYVRSTTRNSFKCAVIITYVRFKRRHQSSVSRSSPSNHPTPNPEEFEIAWLAPHGFCFSMSFFTTNLHLDRTVGLTHWNTNVWQVAFSSWMTLWSGNWWSWSSHFRLCEEWYKRLRWIKSSRTSWKFFFLAFFSLWYRRSRAQSWALLFLENWLCPALSWIASRLSNILADNLGQCCHPLVFGCSIFGIKVNDFTIGESHSETFFNKHVAFFILCKSTLSSSTFASRDFFLCEISFIIDQLCSFGEIDGGSWLTCRLVISSQLGANELEESSTPVLSQY